MDSICDCEYDREWGIESCVKPQVFNRSNRQEVRYDQQGQPGLRR
jgi:hypothetical protein